MLLSRRSSVARPSLSDAEPKVSDFLDLTLDTVMMNYLAGSLSPAERQLVEQRKRTDKKFRARAQRLTRVWKLLDEWRDPPDFRDPPIEAEAEFTSVEGESRLERATRGIHRRPSPRARRFTPRGFRPPHDAKDFVWRLAPELGTDHGMILVDQAFDIVEETGEPDSWILEVGRARDRGTLRTAVAHYLIWHFADSALVELAFTHPVLSGITTEIMDFERKHGIDEDKRRHLIDGPSEWAELYREWITAYNELVMETFWRNGEGGIADTYAVRDEALYTLGRTLIFGDESDD
jgi:hypothetical protein